eukprot:TRINITY_DN9141_c0_g1_i1.p1 TRINITY_DN9141_c0_g1~~TRINITY_DN9141_c0_g1_i1.p1  ORF type:complete len:334 (+),score=109.98 TRINITY_DN9141_c0_g1_i1:100-1101(+)
MNRVFLFFAVLSFHATVAQNTGAPILPNQYLVSLEANIKSSNTSLNMREYYDLPNGRARYELNTQDNYTWIIVDFRTSSYYQVINMQSCQKLSYTAGSTDFLPSGYRPLEILSTYGDMSTAAFVGVDEVRGVPCNVWQTHVQYSDGPFNLTTHSLNITYYYALPAWNFGIVTNMTMKPMRIMLTGTRSFPGQPTFYVNNYYELINFVPRAPLPALFEVPDECLPVSESVFRIIYTSSGAGLAAGMFFIGLFVGMAILGIGQYAHKQYLLHQAEEKKKRAEERAKRKAKKRRAAERLAKKQQAGAAPGSEPATGPQHGPQQPHDSAIVHLDDAV